MTSFKTRRRTKARRSLCSLATFLLGGLTLFLFCIVCTFRIHMNMYVSNGDINSNNGNGGSLSSSSMAIKSTSTQPKSIPTANTNNVIHIRPSSKKREEQVKHQMQAEEQAQEQGQEQTQAQVKEQGHLITNNGLLQGVLKRDHGKGWEILRSDNGMVPNTGITEFNPHGYQCRWSEFQSTSGNTAQMCVHNFFDFVSRSINNKKRWEDCDVLPKLWNTTRTDGDNADNGDGLYVEVGANIGSCVMEMLLSTNANIIAFEPHPRNLFHLRSTISKLDPSMQNRVVIVPIALGEATATSKIFSAKNNMGNSVVGRAIKDYETQEMRESEEHEIAIERMDSILDVGGALSHTHIRLMKMDAQGFECHVLEGMGSVLPQYIQALHFEFARKWLQGQECLDLLPRVRAIGFDIYRGFRRIESDTLEREVVELLGKRRK